MNYAEFEHRRYLMKSRVWWAKNIFSLVIGIPAWIWLWSFNWKLMIALFLCMWANNLMISTK